MKRQKRFMTGLATACLMFSLWIDGLIPAWASTVGTAVNSKIQGSTVSHWAPYTSVQLMETPGGTYGASVPSYHGGHVWKQGLADMIANADRVVRIANMVIDLEFVDDDVIITDLVGNGNINIGTMITVDGLATALQRLHDNHAGSTAPKPKVELLFTDPWQLIYGNKLDEIYEKLADPVPSGGWNFDLIVSWVPPFEWFGLDIDHVFPNYNHAKIVVVDDQIAWVGGNNFQISYLGSAGSFEPVHDFGIIVEGPGASYLGQIHSKIYDAHRGSGTKRSRCTWEGSLIPIIQTCTSTESILPIQWAWPAPGGTDVYTLARGGDRRQADDAIEAAFDVATSAINMIQVGVTKGRAEDMVARAALRGVEVRLALNANGDKHRKNLDKRITVLGKKLGYSADQIHQAKCDNLLIGHFVRNGRAPQMSLQGETHAKFFSIDGLAMYAGSQNLYGPAFGSGPIGLWEAGVLVDDPFVTQEADTSFESMWAEMILANELVDSPSCSNDVPDDPGYTCTNGEIPLYVAGSKHVVRSCSIEQDEPQWEVVYAVNSGSGEYEEIHDFVLDSANTNVAYLAHNYDTEGLLGRPEGQLMRSSNLGAANPTWTSILDPWEIAEAFDNSYEFLNYIDNSGNLNPLRIQPDQETGIPNASVQRVLLPPEAGGMIYVLVGLQIEAASGQGFNAPRTCVVRGNAGAWQFQNDCIATNNRGGRAFAVNGGRVFVGAKGDGLDYRIDVSYAGGMNFIPGDQITFDTIAPYQPGDFDITEPPRDIVVDGSSIRIAHAGALWQVIGPFVAQSDDLGQTWTMNHEMADDNFIGGMAPGVLNGFAGFTETANYPTLWSYGGVEAVSDFSGIGLAYSSAMSVDYVWTAAKTKPSGGPPCTTSDPKNVVAAFILSSGDFIDKTGNLCALLGSTWRGDAGTSSAVMMAITRDPGASTLPPAFTGPTCFDAFGIEVPVGERGLRPCPNGPGYQKCRCEEAPAPLTPWVGMWDSCSPVCLQ